MSYFDHVQCHSCGARLNPEQLAPGREGEMPSCPHCNTTLNLTDLFGVKDSFVGLHDDQGNDHTLDDLLTNDLYDGRYVDGRPPSAQQAPPQRQAPRRAAPQQGRQSSGGAPSLRQLTGSAPSSNSGALVRSGRSRDAWEDDEDQQPQGDAPSAADLLRSMKKKR